tara:strand:+ start:1199 stop:1522 length:324 start_codon:yes stop_codon:yes gene_type:complete
MTNETIYSNLNENRMVFDLESKKAMSIPDGEYELRTDMADYRLDTDDFFMMQWASGHKVKVVNGEWDIPSVLKASQHLMDACGYWGVYVEQLDYDYEGDFIELTVGS